MKNRRTELYNNLLSSGMVTENEIGTYDQFESAIKDDASARELYGNLTKSGKFTTKELGTVDEFSHALAPDFFKTPTLGEKKQAPRTPSEALRVAGEGINRLKENPTPQQFEASIVNDFKSGEGAGFEEGIKSLSAQWQDHFAKDYTKTDEFRSIMSDSSLSADEREKKASDRFAELYSDKINEQLQPYYDEYNGRLQETATPLLEATSGHFAKQAVEEDISRLESDYKTLYDTDEEVQVGYSLSPSTGGSTGIPLYGRAHKGYLETARKLMDSARTREQANKDSKGFFGGVKDVLTDYNTWTLGITEAAQSAHVLDVFEKMDRDEPLDKYEQLVADSFLAKAAAEQYYQTNRLYGIGGGAGASIPFMLEFIATMGTSAALGKAATTAVSRGVQKYILKKVASELGEEAVEQAAKGGIKGLAKGLGQDLVTSSANTAIFRQGHVAGKYLSNKMGDVRADVDPLVGVTFGGRENTMDGVGAYANAFATETAETQSELLGGRFANILGVVNKGLLKLPLLKKIPTSKLGKSYANIVGSDGFKAVRDIGERMGFNGTFGEFGEEMYNNLANVALGNTTKEEAFALDNMIDTYLTVSIIGTSFGIVGAAGYEADKYNTKRRMRKAEAELGKSFDFDAIKQNLSEGSVENAREMMLSVMDSPLTKTEKTEMIGYIGDYLRFAESTPKELSPEDFPQIEEHAVTTLTDYEKAKQNVPQEYAERIEAGESVDMIDPDNAIPEQERIILEDYEVKLAGVNEYNQMLESQRSFAVEQARGEVNKIYNSTMGGVVAAFAPSVSDKPIMVVGGSIKFKDDGSIDQASSSTALYYIDQDGKRKMMPTSSVEKASIESVDDTVAEMAQVSIDAINASDQSRREEAAFASSSVKLGESVTYQGKPYTVANISPDGSLQIEGEGGVIEVAQSEVVREGANTPQTSQDTPQIESNTPQNTEGEEPAPSTALSKIPRDEQGEYLYEQSTPDVAWDAVVEEAGNEATALEVASSMLKDKEAALKKAQKSEPKGKSVREKAESAKQKESAIAAAQAEVDFWSNVLLEQRKREEGANPPAKPVSSQTEADYSSANSEEEADQILLESEDVVGLARAYEIEKALYDEYVDSHWSQYLTKMKPEGFHRAGDRNLTTGGIAKAWFSKDGANIDTLAMEIGEITGLEITPQMIVDFITENPNGLRKTSEKAITFARRFSEVASAKTGKRIGYPTSKTGIAFLEAEKQARELDAKALEQYRKEEKEFYLYKLLNHEIENGDLYIPTEQEPLDYEYEQQARASQAAQGFTSESTTSPDGESPSHEEYQRGLNQVPNELNGRGVNQGEPTEGGLYGSGTSTTEEEARGDGALSEQSEVTNNIEEDAEQRTNATIERDNDEQREADSRGVADDSTSETPNVNNRGDIRVLEEGLGASYNEHSIDSERNRRSAESERLVKVAKENNLFIPLSKTKNYGKRHGKRTGESTVYIDEKSNKVYKVKNPYAKAALKNGVQPEDVIFEHQVHNLLFPETKYTLEGISEEYGDEVRLVLSQEFIQTYGQPTKEQIAEALAKRGLYPEDNYSFGNDLVSVTDVEGDNVLLGEDGELYFIDPIIRFKQPAKTIIEALTEQAQITPQSAMVREVVERMGIQDIEVVNDVSQIPESEATAIAAINQGRTVKGWYNPQTGKAYLYTPNAADSKDVEATILHEVIAHKGVRELLGAERFSQLCDKIWAGMSEESRKEMVGYALNTTDAAAIAKGMISPDVQRVAADEYMAHLSEGGIEDATAWETIKQFIRELIDSLGIRSEVTDADIRSILRASYENQRGASSLEEGSDVRFRTIEQVNARFNEELQQQIDGTLPKGHVYSLGMPSDVLRASGFDNLPIELAASRLSDKSMQENHPFELEEVADLPRAVQEPIAVFRSATRLGSMVVFTEIEHRGRNFVVAVQLNRRKGRIEVNAVRSVYPKGNTSVTSWINEGLLEYVDKKKISEWFPKQQSNSADVRKSLRDATKIVESFENPTIGDVNNSDGVRFRTEQTPEVKTEINKRVSVLAKAANFIRNGLNMGVRGRSFEIELPTSTRNKINAKMGRDFDSHNITINGVVHALKNHGENGVKNSIKSIPITTKDAELIPYIMCAPDIVERGSTENSRDSIRFYKNLENGYVVVVEKEQKNSPDDMDTITMWAELSNAPDVKTPGHNVQNAIISTSDAAKIRKDAEKTIERDVMFRDSEFDISNFTPEEQEIIDNAGDNAFKAPNGEPTNLTHKQWAQVRTKAFKDWFGDWENDPENSSKVVDANGEPLVVYHGSTKHFTEFRVNKDKNHGFSDGAYFTSDKKFANTYTLWGNMYDTFLNIRNPLFIDAKGAQWNLIKFDDVANATKINIDELESKVKAIDYPSFKQIVGNLFKHKNERSTNKYYSTNSIVKLARILGNDGCIMIDVKDGGKILWKGPKTIKADQIVVLDPNQIKSATDNNGDFSTANNDIRFRFAKTPEEFDAVQREAVEKRGIVAPNLNSARVAVVNVPRHGFTGSGKQAIEKAKEWAKSNLVGSHVAEMQEPFEYTIDNNAIKKYLSGITTSLSDNLGVHLSVLKELPSIISNSIEGEVHPDYLKVDGKRSANSVVAEDVLIHRLYGAVNIDGDTYRVKTTIKENRESGNKPYSYEVTKVELLKSGSSLNGTSSSDALSNSTFISATKLLKGVEKSYDKGKYLLNESEDLTNNSDSTTQSSPQEQMRSEVETIAESLNTPITVIEDVETITHPDPTEQARRRKAKGWYNTKTGEVVVVLPNATSLEDARQTVLHEVVGHKGLRKLFGEKFDKLLDDVYKMATPATKEKIGKGKNATEEYLATLAQADSVEPTFWARLRFGIYKMFRSIGIHVNFSDNELRYILWRSKQNLTEGVMDVAKDVAMQNELGVLFREGAANSYDARLNSKSFNAEETWTDAMLSLKILQEEVCKESGKELKDFENSYRIENQMSSKSNSEAMRYKNREYNRLEKAVADLVTKENTYEDLLHYMMLKHGVERNVEMSVRKGLEAIERKTIADYAIEELSVADRKEIADDAKRAMLERMSEFIQEKKKLRTKRLSDIDYLTELVRLGESYCGVIKDNSGSNAILKLRKLEKGTESALDFVREYEEKHDTVELWKATKAAASVALEKTYQGGITSLEEKDKIQAMYNFYIPLRGFDGETADDVYKYVPEEKSFVNAKKKAGGRNSIAKDPIATIGVMTESAIAQSNRNLMKQAILNLAINHKSNLLTIRQAWYVKNEMGEWEPKFPKIEEGDSPDVVAQKMEEHEAAMKALGENATQKKKGLNIDYITYGKMEKQHIVKVKRNGKDYEIYINGDPRAAQAINGLTKHKQYEGAGWAALRWVNNKMAKAYTTWSPKFIVTNGERDTVEALQNVWIKENLDYFVKYRSNLAKARSISRKCLFNSEEDPLFEEFLLNGGETGYLTITNVDEYQKRLEADIKSLQKGITPKKITDTIVGAIDTTNRWVETMNRFAVYMTSREMGRSITRSIEDAKEVTVNFNRSGSGNSGRSSWHSIPAGYMRTWTLFSNPAIQSLVNTARLASKEPVKYTSSMLMYAAVAFINRYMWNLLTGDDDPVGKLSPWERRNNLCLGGFDGMFAKISLPHSYRAFYGIGDMAYDYIVKGEELNIGNFAVDIARSLSTMLPLDPLSNDWQVWKAIVPSSIKPLVEVLTNQDFMGMPIYRDNGFNELDPEFQRVYGGTSKTLTGWAKWLNELTGGNDFLRGGIDRRIGALSIKNGDKEIGFNLSNPAVWEHIITSYTGGMADFILDTVDFGSNIVSSARGKDVDWSVRNIPMASAFVTSINARHDVFALNQKYYDIIDEYKVIEHELQGLKRNFGDPDKGEGYIRQYTSLIESDNGKKNYLNIKQYVSAINRLNSTKKKLITLEEDTTEIDEALEELKSEVVKLVDEYEE